MEKSEPKIMTSQAGMRHSDPNRPSKFPRNVEVLHGAGRGTFEIRCLRPSSMGGDPPGEERNTDRATHKAEPAEIRMPLAPGNFVRSAKESIAKGG